MEEKTLVKIAGAALSISVGAAIAACVVDIRYSFAMMGICIVAAFVGGAALQFTDKG